jgi:DnaJ-class molecular chaperone
MSNIDQKPGVASAHIGGIPPERGPAHMKTMTQKIKEHTCPACKGTGFPVVKQPVLASRRIYPVKCVACTGKGKITDAD